MYVLLVAPGWYNPIQSVELGAVIELHAAVRVLPEGMEVGLAERVGACPPRRPLPTVKVLLVARTVDPILVSRRSSYGPGGRLPRTNGHDPEARGLPGVLEQLT